MKTRKSRKHRRTDTQTHSHTHTHTHTHTGKEGAGHKSVQIDICEYKEKYKKRKIDMIQNGVPSILFPRFSCAQSKFSSFTDAFFT